MMAVVRRNPIVITGAIAGVAIGGAQLAAGDPPWRAALALVFTIGYGLLVTGLARRSETASVLAGRPVDERWEHLNLEASAWALGATAMVALAAFVVAEATGADWLPYAFICVVIAIAYLGSLVLLRIRG